jgi:hypothetical protein
MSVTVTERCCPASAAVMTCWTALASELPAAEAMSRVSGLGGRVDDQRGTDGVVADQAAGGRWAAGCGRVQRVRWNAVEPGDQRSGLWGGRDHGEHDPVRRGRMERSRVGQDETDLQQQDPDDQADRAD